MKNFPFALFGSFCVLLCLATLAPAQKLKPDEIVAKHLDSIGTGEARSAAKSRLAVGRAVVTFITQKNQKAEGRIVMASSGEKNFLGLNLNAMDYPGEKFSFDGANAKVATVINGQRSFFGNFIGSNNLILKDSLMGSALASSWALSDLSRTKAKISYDGTKKINGREHYVLGYSSKESGDLDISLYFDRESFRHTRTEYRRTSSAGIGVNPDQSSGFSETRLKVIEDYSDFKAVNGLTLPHTYKVLYSIAGQRGTTEVEWAYTLDEIVFNRVLDPKTFDAEAR
jgi:hypothetical protein